MESYCKKCKTERDFDLIANGTTHDTYKCNYCGLEVENPTAFGVLGGAATLLTVILGGIKLLSSDQNLKD